MANLNSIPPLTGGCFNCTRHRYYGCNSMEDFACGRCEREERTCVRLPQTGQVTYRQDCCCEGCRGTPDATACDASLWLGLGCTRCRLRDHACEVRGVAPGAGPGVAALPPRPDGYTRPMCCDQCAWDPVEDASVTVKTCSWRASPPGVRPSTPCRTCVRRGRRCTINGADPARMAAAAATARFQPSHLLLTKTFPSVRAGWQYEFYGNPREAPDGILWSGPRGLQPENAWVGIRVPVGSLPPVNAAGPGVMANFSIPLQ